MNAPGDAIHRGGGFGIAACRHLHDGQDHREQVLDAVVQFLGEEVRAIARFGNDFCVGSGGFGLRGADRLPQPQHQREDDDHEQQREGGHDTRFGFGGAGSGAVEVAALHHVEPSHRAAQAIHGELALIAEDADLCIDHAALPDELHRAAHFGPLGVAQPVDLVEQGLLLFGGFVAQPLAQGGAFAFVVGSAAIVGFEIAPVGGNEITALCGLAVDRGCDEAVERGQHARGAVGLFALHAFGFDRGKDQRKRAQQRHRHHSEQCERGNARRAPPPARALVGLGQRAFGRGGAGHKLA